MHKVLMLQTGRAIGLQCCVSCYSQQVAAASTLMPIAGYMHGCLHAHVVDGQYCLAANF